MIKKILKIGTILFLLVLVGNIIYFSLNIPNVAVIHINGIITPLRADNWINQINQAEKNDNIKAILVKIDSPGGEACSSQRLYLALKEASKNKFTIALIETLGASGAYFAACGADKIVAYPASTVGSIGVIFETLNFSTLAKKIGISLFVVKTGKVKDVGNPFRKPTDADKKMLSNIINNIYQQFMKAVSTGRHIPIKKVKKIANGSVFTGEQALHLGLIDSVGGMKEVKKLIKRYANISRIHLEDFAKNTNIAKRILNSITNFSYAKLLLQPTPKAIYQ